MLGNPIKYSDPTGHCVFVIVDTLICIGAAEAVLTAVSAALIVDAGVRGNDSIAGKSAQALADLANLLIPDAPPPFVDAAGPSGPGHTGGQAPVINAASPQGIPLGPIQNTTPGGMSLPPSQTTGDRTTTSPLNPTAGLVTSGPMLANPNGSNGNPAHQKAVADLQTVLGNQWPGYTVMGNKSIDGMVNAHTGKLISSNRRPDAVVLNPAREVVQIGEAYRSTNPTSNRPVQRERVKMAEYQIQQIPSLWKRVR